MNSGGRQRPDPFCLPLRNLDEAQAVVREIEALLGERKLCLRSPPPVPDTCCGRGCNGCVWQGYFAALAYWRGQAREILIGETSAQAAP